MKSVVLVVSFVLAASLNAAAQFGGLPLANSAEQVGKGAMQATGALTFGNDLNVYGGRFGCAVIDNFTAFGDIGWADPDKGGGGPALQGGGMYAFRTGLPVDIAVRAAASIAFLDETDLMGCMGSGVLSGSPQALPALTLYGQMGIAFNKDNPDQGDSHSETDFVITGGALYLLGNRFSLFGEIGAEDDFYCALGGRYTF
jgi:hypothetical protein